MAVVHGPQWFPHPTQKCKNDGCEGRIMVRPRWDDGSGQWGGREEAPAQREAVREGLPGRQERRVRPGLVALRRLAALLGGATNLGLALGPRLAGELSAGCGLLLGGHLRFLSEGCAGTPKSKTSKRTVPPPPWLAARTADYLAPGTVGAHHPYADDPTAVLWPRRLAGNASRKPVLDWSAPLDLSGFQSKLMIPALEPVGLPARWPRTSTCRRRWGHRRQKQQQSCDFKILSVWGVCPHQDRNP